MKRVTRFVIGIIGLLVLVSCGSLKTATSKADREWLLHEGMVPENDWRIATEAEMEGYLVSAIYTPDNKSGLAIFEAVENGKYKFKYATTTDINEVVVDHQRVGENYYDLIWFNGAQTEYAEVIYTVDGRQQDAIRFDTRDMAIVITQSPAKEYSIQVIYYDADGNTYEAPMVMD